MVSFRLNKLLKVNLPTAAVTSSHLSLLIHCQRPTTDFYRLKRRYAANFTGRVKFRYPVLAAELCHSVLFFPLCRNDSLIRKTVHILHHHNCKRDRTGGYRLAISASVSTLRVWELITITVFFLLRDVFFMLLAWSKWGAFNQSPDVFTYFRSFLPLPPSSPFSNSRLVTYYFQL